MDADTHHFEFSPPLTTTDSTSNELVDFPVDYDSMNIQHLILRSLSSFGWTKTGTCQRVSGKVVLSNHILVEER